MPAASPSQGTVSGTIPGCIVGQVQVGGAQGTIGTIGTIPLLCQPYKITVEICSSTIPGTVPGTMPGTIGTVPCTVPPCTFEVEADAYGQFVMCGLPPGTYTLRVRGFNTLYNVHEGIVVPEAQTIPETIPGTIPVDFGTLTPADANADNEVGMLDYSVLATAYPTAPGDPRWDDRADFNCDGEINMLDYSLLATHYAKAGASCP